MPFTIKCPACMHELTLKESFVGKRVYCPLCGEDFEALPDAKNAWGTDIMTPPLPMELPPADLSSTYIAINAVPLSVNVEAAPFCLKCGAELASSQAVCLACGKPTLDSVGERVFARPVSRRLPPLNGFVPVLGVMFLFIGLAVISLAVFVDGMHVAPQSIGVVVGLCVGGVVLETAALACFVFWLYQAWRLMARDDDDYFPSLKVGLLFVPFFNLYWMFHVIVGLSAEIERELLNFAPACARSGRSLGVLVCVFMLAPGLQPFAICMFMAWTLITNNAIQRLIRYHERLRAEEATHDAARHLN